MRNAKGFTLAELLVVVAVLALLVSLLIPVAHDTLGRATQVICAGQLHTIGQAATMAQQDAGRTRMITAANWQKTLWPYVSHARSTFVCPNGPVVTETSSGGGGSGGGAGTPAPGGTSNETNYVYVRCYWSSNQQGGVTLQPGYGPELGAGLPLSEDSGWFMHFSQWQKDNVTDASGRYFGDPLARWLDTGTSGAFNFPAYVPDGTGISYWGFAFTTRWGGFSAIDGFVKVEPAGGGGGTRLWPCWNNIRAARGASGPFTCLFSTANENATSSKGPTVIQKDTTFAPELLHTYYAYCYPEIPTAGHTAYGTKGGVPQPDWILAAGPGPLLQGGHHPSEIYGVPSCPGCSGKDDWIILGGPAAGDDGGGSGAGGGASRTNYGMNTLATALGRPRQILALDYPNVVADPAADNWAGASWDGDADGALDFARHFERVNVLFVDGTVELKFPHEIDPQDNEFRSTLWNAQ